MNTYNTRFVLFLLSSVAFISSEFYVQALSIDLILPPEYLIPGEEARYSVYVNSTDNVTCLLEYGDSACCTVLTSECFSSVDNLAYHVTTYVYSTAGVFNISLTCEDESQNDTKHGTITVQRPVEGLQFTTTENIILEKRDDIINGDINFFYQNGTSVEAKCVILGGGDCSQTTTINTVSKNGTISFLPTYFPTVGEYTLALWLENNVSYFNLNKSVIVEERIQGLIADIPDTVLVNSTISVRANVTYGSNVEYFWIIGSSTNTTLWFLCSGINATGSFVHQFSEPGQTVFEVEAINALGKATVTKTVFAVVPVNGFSAQTTSNVPGADLVLTTSSVLAEHMGNLTVMILSNGEPLHNTTITPTAPGDIYSVYQNLSQGNHNLNITLTSGVSEQEVVLTVALWKRIHTEINVHAIVLEAGSSFIVEILNTTGWGYLYEYNYGDLHDNSTGESNEINQFLSTNKQLHYRYADGGVYTFEVEVSNPMHRKDLNVTFFVFHPVPEFDFRASTAIAIPSGELSYTITIGNKLAPTNASCILHQLKGNTITTYNYSWDQIVNSNQIGVFISDGVYNVSLTCFNEISSVSKSVVVKAFEIKGEMFNVSYDYFQGLNDTDDSVEVIYNIFYYDNTFMPTGAVILEWEFGDGSSYEPVNITSWTKTHRFSQRGVFNSSLNILIPAQNTWSIPIPIQIGILAVEPLTFVGKVNEDVMTLIIAGAVGQKVDYVIDFGDGNVVNCTEIEADGTSVLTKQKTYTTAGFFQIKITASSDVFVEEKLIPNVHILWPIEGLILEVEQEITVPNAEGVIRILLDGTAPQPSNMSCVIRYSDKSAIDFLNSPGEVRHRFTGIGEVDVTATCNNSVSSMELTNSTSLKSTCFGPSPPFNHYTGNLMKLISDKITLSAVFDVLCTNMTLQFIWNVSKDGIPIIFEQPNSTVLVLYPRMLQAGIHKISFHADFDEFPEIYLSDSVIVTYSQSDIVAGIYGGSVRTVGRPQSFILDGSSQSNDPDIDPAVDHVDQGLSYNWACQKTSDISSAESVVSTGSSNPCGGCVTGMSTGILTVRPGCLDTNAWHVFILTVTKDIRMSKTAQIIHVVSAPTPQILLRCRSNCLPRKNAEFSIQFESECSDCSQEDLVEVVFAWRLYRRTEPNGVEKLVPEFEIITSTGVNISAMSILPNSLSLGYTYRLELLASNMTGKTTGSVSETFQMNYPPYNGSCSITPREGRAMLDTFTMSCSGWVDEEARSVRSSLDNGDRLTYQVLHSTHEGDTSLIYSGDSRTSPPTKLSVGREDDDYKSVIIVRVIDAYNGIVESSLKVKVLSPVQQTEIQALSNVSSILNEFQSEVEKSVINGDLQQSSRKITSVVSVIHTLVLPEDDTIFTEAADSWLNTQPLDLGLENETALPWTEIWNDLITPPDTELQDNLTQETSVYVDSIASLVERNVVNSADSVFYVSSTLSNLLNKPQYVSGDSLIVAVDAIEEATASLEGLFTEDTGDFRVKEVLTSVMSSLDKMVAAALPQFPVGTRAIDVSTVLQETELLESYESKESVLLGNQAKERADIHNDERAFFATRAYIKQQYENEKKQELAKAVLNQIMQTLDKGMSVAGRLLVVGQDPIHFHFPTMTSSVQKLKIKDYMTTTANREGTSVSIENAPDFGVENPTVVFKTTVFTKIPFVWDEDGESSGITSKSIGLDLSPVKPNGLDSFTNIDITLKISVPNSETVQYVTVTPEFIPLDRDEMLYHKLELRSTNDSIILFLTSPIPFVKYDVYFRSGQFPTSTDYHYKTSIPPTHTSLGLPKLKVICPGGKLPNSGPVYVGLKPYELEMSDRKKRSTSLVRSPSNQSTIHSDYGFGVGTVGCKVWNNAKSEWVENACTVSLDSSESQTVCSCTSKLTRPFTIATSFVVPVNKIDFSTVFAKIDLLNNASVLATMLSLLIVYFLLAAWARHRDCSDFLKWGVTPLVDNKPIDPYVYIVTVTTGMRPGAGTKSKIGLSLSGTEHESMNRTLYDGIRDEFPTRSVLNFLLVEPYPLGELQYIRVWHDDSGTGDAASWFLQNITIEDIQTDIRYTFLCGRWLAVDKDDGKIERILPATGKSDLLTFSHLFNNNIRQNVTDSHIWLSVLMRPTQSHFTRLQRLSCCLSLLFLTMITSAMFYRAEENIVRPTLITIGSLRFSLQQLYVSFISILIVTPVNLLLVMLFKKTKPDDQRKPSILDHRCFSRCFPGAEKRAKLAVVMITKKTYSVNERMLPHYIIYLNWVILFTSVALSSFFIFFFSQQWGKAKSEEWLTSFLLSFFESLIVMDPLKVVLITVFLSLVFRNKNDKDGTTLDKTQLGTQKKYLIDGDDNDLPPGPANPLNEDAVKISQTLRRDESTAFGIVKEVTFYVIFLVVLFTIGYSTRDSRSFAMRENVYNTLVRKQSDKRIGLENIRSREQFFRWVNETAFPVLFAENYYEGSRRHWRERYYIKDLQNYRVGPPRLRQLRSAAVKSCHIHQLGEIPCKDGYSIITEESRDFCIGWNGLPCPEREHVDLFTSAAWRFTSSVDIWGLPIWGQYNTYGGGGYISVLDVNYQVSSVMLEEEFRYLWLDTQTRAVNLEFTLYNPNVNMFVYVVLLVEFPETGGAIPTAFVLPFRAYHLVGALGTYILINQVILLLFIVFATIKVILTIKKYRLCFFADPWNALDFACLITCYLCIVMFFLKEHMVEKAMEKFNENPKKFVNFQHITVWDDFLVYFIGLVCFFCTIRMIKILGYNKRISSIASVIQTASRDLISFSFLFAIVFIGFTILGYLLFGRALTAYNGMLKTAATLLTSMIGKTPFDEMRRTEPIVAQIYFAFFVFFVVFILLTMFLSILNDTISQIHKEDCADDSRHKVFDILLAKFKESFGISAKKTMSMNNLEVSKDLPFSEAARKMNVDSEFALKVLEADLDKYHPLVNVDSDGYPQTT